MLLEAVTIHSRNNFPYGATGEDARQTKENPYFARFLAKIQILWLRGVLLRLNWHGTAIPNAFMLSL